MVTLTETVDQMRNKIREDIDHLDSDTIKKIYTLISEEALDEAMDLATEEWDKNHLSAEKIQQSIDDYRKNKNK